MTKELFKVIMGKKCKYIRNHYGMTTMELAYLTNYGEANIKMFETGKVNNAYLLCFYTNLALKGYKDKEPLIKSIYEFNILFGDILWQK